MLSLSQEFSNYIQASDYLDSRAIAFIDSRIPNCDNLIQQATSEVRVIVFGLQAQAMKSITQTLNSSFCQQLYLITAGQPGCLYLGRDELSRNTLIQYQSQLSSWFARTDRDSATPLLHLCGCDVAAGDVGAEFITELSMLTGAKITASKNVYSSLLFN